MRDQMKLYLGLLSGSRPSETRVFGEIDGKLVDLNLACAAYLTQSQNARAAAYDFAEFYFPKDIASFLERGALALKMLGQVSAFVHNHSRNDLRGPAGETILYEPKDVRRLPPLENPEKSFVIGFSDKARTQGMPKPELPTGYYKLPQTFVTDGAPIVWPKFSSEVDADGCLAIIIGKAGRRISPENAWEYVGGVSLVIDITARNINRREGLTTNNLLGKNFRSSTSLGPAVLLESSRNIIETLKVQCSIDGEQKQHFCLRNCVFTVEQIIAHWSILGIKPGDWLAIGASMALDGDQLQNPVPLKIGSRIRCSSPLIGDLSHQVVAA